MLDWESRRGISFHEITIQNATERVLRTYNECGHQVAVNGSRLVSIKKALTAKPKQLLLPEQENTIHTQNE